MYRIKQFIWALTSNFKKIDSEYIDKFLDSKEKELFNKLRHNEKHHCIRVSKDAINIAKEKNLNIDEKKLAKVSLLHDVGKGEHGLNLIEKSTLVILNKITRGKLKKFNNIKNVDIYYNHGKKGVTLLKNLSKDKYDKEFLETIEFHHDKNMKKENLLLNIIRESDDKN